MSWENMAVDLAATAHVTTITTTSTVTTLTSTGHYHLVTAVGDAAYLKAGASGSGPTATTSVGGFSICIPEGAVVRMMIPSSLPEVAIIGVGAGVGFVQFVPENVFP